MATDFMSSTRDTVLVTAVGAVIGYGVVRCLQKLPFPPRIVGTDIYRDAVGQRWCDRFSKAVPAADSGFIDWLLEAVSLHQVDLVIPCTEYEIEVLHNNRERLQSCPAVIVLNRPEVIDKTHDKWLAHGFFRAAGIPTIPSRIDGNYSEAVAELGLPMLAKLRRSDAGKGMQVVNNEAEFDDCRASAGCEFMVQKIVGNDEEEFTASVFGFGNGTALSGPVLRRKLSRAGATDKAWTFEDPALTALVDALTAELKPLGPTNYQFRKHDGSYLVLEVNPRVSSATSIREAFGFNEAALCVEWFLRGRRPAPPVLRQGSVLRYIADSVVYDE